MAFTPQTDSRRDSLAVPRPQRPTVSRSHSHTSAISVNSTASRPRPQNEHYIPSGAVALGGEPGQGDEGVSRWLYDDETVPQVPDEVQDEEAEESEEEDEQSIHDQEWEMARIGSIARRSLWRRPKPAWIYPFIIAATLTMGMSAAPRSEIYINLACLSHPPRQPSSMEMIQMVGLNAPAATPSIHGQPPWTNHGNVSLPSAPPPQHSRSAADEWFLRMQREMYEWELAHQKHKPEPEQHTSFANPTTSTVYPSGPLPHPTDAPRSGGENQTAPSDGPSSSPVVNHPPFRAIDPALCKRDVKVQAAAARLTMSMLLVAGTLSALTTGYWGQKSDKIGRTKIMSITTIGLMFAELNFVLVASFPYLAPGGYRALLIGPFIDGLFGGYATISATVHAYISDTTPDGSRASAFARLAGITMFGFASGPILGSLLINATGNIMIPFYCTVCIHATYIPLYYFLLPESLSTEARRHLRKMAKITRLAEKRRDALEREWEDEDPTHVDEVSDNGIRSAQTGHSKRRKKFIGNARRFLRRITRFARPLQVFAPTIRPDGTKDYNLMLIGLGMFVTSLMMGNMIVKTQYAFYSFGWTSSQLGPYMSALGATRGVTLLVILPVIMHYVKPHFRQAGHIGETPTLEAPQIREPSSSTIDSGITPAPPSNSQPSALDLITVRICMFLEFSGWTLLAFGQNARNYVLCSMVITLGSATSPALNSLALSLIPSQAEAGRLFGAISVVSAIGATLISPLIFGNLFALTVGWYAPTIFVLCAFIMACAQICISLIKLDGPDEQLSAERGRSRRIKRVNSSGISRRPEFRSGRTNSSGKSGSRGRS